MPVVVCSSCQARINAKEEALGKKAKCPKCATVILLQAAAAPAKETPIQAKPPAAAIKPKPKPAAPPPMAAEIVEELDELEEVAPARRKPSRAADEFEEEDEPRPTRRRRRDEEDEDDFDDEPRPKRRSRNDDDDFDDGDDDRPRRGRISRGGWTGVRTGLNLVYFAILGAIAMFAISAMMQILVVSTVAVPQPNAPINRPGDLGMILSIAFAVAALAGLLGLVAGIMHFVGQCFCISAPAKKAKMRAQVAVFTLVGSVVMGLLSACMMPFIGAGAAHNAVQQAQKIQIQNPPNNPQIAAQNQQAMAQNMLGQMLGFGIVGAILLLILLALIVTSLVFWILFLAATAEAFHDRALQSQILIYLAVSLIAPFVIFGVNIGMGFMIAAAGRIILILMQFINAAAWIGIMVWAMLINRRLVRLIDADRG